MIAILVIGRGWTPDIPVPLTLLSKHRIRHLYTTRAVVCVLFVGDHADRARKYFVLEIRCHDHDNSNPGKSREIPEIDVSGSIRRSGLYGFRPTVGAFTFAHYDYSRPHIVIVPVRTFAPWRPRSPKKRTTVRAGEIY